MSDTQSPVSSDDESLILVDSADEVLGYASKEACHNGAGQLHRAFSVFIFNSAGEVLLQRRSAQKRLWALYWSNSCCSHPRRGESVEQAAQRRIREELGIRTSLSPIYKFEYQASFGRKGSEHELCHVLIGKCDAHVTAHPDEIAEVCYMPAEQLDEALASQSQRYTPWLKLEWDRLRSDYWAEVLQTLQG